jgi:hypothetical protein
LEESQLAQFKALFADRGSQFLYGSVEKYGTNSFGGSMLLGRMNKLAEFETVHSLGPEDLPHLRKFLSEALLAKGLKHPNIVNVGNWFRFKRDLYFSLEGASGHDLTLSDIITYNIFNEKAIAYVCREVNSHFTYFVNVRLIIIGITWRQILEISWDCAS